MQSRGIVSYSKATWTRLALVHIESSCVYTQRLVAHLSSHSLRTAPSLSFPPSFSQAYGHSSVVNPWGEVIATTGHEPALITAELDLSQVDDFRTNIPLAHQRRDDIYSLQETRVVDKIIAVAGSEGESEIIKESWMGC